MDKMTRQTKQQLAKLKKEYRKANMEKVKEQNRKSYLKNRDKRLAHDKKYYEENKETISKRHKKYAQDNKEQRKQISQKHRKANPQKVKARALANYYIQIPANKMCVECGINPAIERHHKDYSKPLAVQLVCNPCHTNNGGII